MYVRARVCQTIALPVTIDGLVDWAVVTCLITSAYRVSTVHDIFTTVAGNFTL